MHPATFIILTSSAERAFRLTLLILSVYSKFKWHGNGINSVWRLEGLQVVIHRSPVS